LHEQDRAHGAGADTVEVAATVGGMSIKNGVFSVVVPMHDWWDHTKIPFCRSDLLSKTSGTVFDFSNDAARQRFHLGCWNQAKSRAWLSDMYP